MAYKAVGGKRMDKPYFPLFVDLSRMKIVMVGGGTIAGRRVRTLTQFNSHITVIAPEISEELKQLSTKGRIQCLCREYQTGDIADADMVLTATNRSTLNRQVAAECRETEAKTGRKILLSVADDRTLCDFYFPAVIKSDEAVIGINSGGASPGAVKGLRKKLEKLLKLYSGDI